MKYIAKLEDLFYFIINKSPIHLIRKKSYPSSAIHFFNVLKGCETPFLIKHSTSFQSSLQVKEVGQFKEHKKTYNRRNEGLCHQSKV